MSEVGKSLTLGNVQALGENQNFWVHVLKRSSVNNQQAAQRKLAEAETSRAVNAFLEKFGYKVDKLFGDYDAKRPPVIERSDKWEKLLPQKTRVENGSLYIKTSFGTQYEIRPNGNIMKLKAGDTAWTIQHRSLKLLAA